MMMTDGCIIFSFLPFFGCWNRSPTESCLEPILSSPSSSSYPHPALPDLQRVDEEGFLECLKRFILFEKDWIPEGDGYSLYIRPTIIATNPHIGVAPATSVKLYVILCPVGPYYASGFKPVRLMADRRYARAWVGGTGNNKLGGNYAIGIKPQVEA